MSVLLKTIVADYSLRQRELLTLLIRSVIVSNNVSATQDDVSECQSIACTLNKIISSTGYKFWAFFFPVLSEILHRQRIIQIAWKTNE